MSKRPTMEDLRDEISKCLDEYVSEDLMTVRIWHLFRDWIKDE